MAKKCKKTTRNCQSHNFSLKPTAKHLPSRTLHLTLSFCSPHPDPQTQSQCVQAPAYNNDGSFASPAFTLPCDQGYYAVRRFKMMEQHELRFNRYTDQKSELNVPKPKSKNSYCNVCRLYYEDYLDHVLSSSHRARVSASPFSKHIKELANQFQSQIGFNPTLTQTSSQKPIIIETISEDSDQVEIISNPHKKIKSEPNTAKESHNNPNLAARTTQPYYPFYNWHPSESIYDPVNVLPFGFNINLPITPFPFGQVMGLGQTQPPFIPRAGFQPFGHIQGYKTKDVGFLGAV